MKGKKILEVIFFLFKMLVQCRCICSTLFQCSATENREMLLINFECSFHGGFIKHKEFRVNLEEIPHSYLQEICLCTPLVMSK